MTLRRLAFALFVLCVVAVPAAAQQGGANYVLQNFLNGSITTASGLCSSGGIVVATGCASQAAYPVQAYGAKCDGITNDAAAFQSAVNAAGAAGGGTVVAPAGKTCEIASTVFNGWNNVILQGGGATGSHNTGTIPAFTKLQWNGASAGGPIYEIAPSPGPSPAQWLQGGGVSNVSFDSNSGLASVLIELLSTRYAQFSWIHLDSAATTYGLYMGTVSQLGEATDSQFNSFSQLNCGTPANTDSGGSCIYLDGGGNPAGNSSFNTFTSLDFTVNSATGLTINNGDNNVFTNQRCFLVTSGTGLCDDLKATSRGNMFYHPSYKAPFLIESGSIDNVLREIDSSNSIAAPTIQPSAQALYTFTSGVHYFMNDLYIEPGTQPTTVPTAQNSIKLHVQPLFSNAPQDWWIQGQGSSGNLAFGLAGATLCQMFFNGGGSCPQSWTFNGLKNSALGSATVSGLCGASATAESQCAVASIPTCSATNIVPCGFTLNCSLSSATTCNGTATVPASASCSGESDASDTTTGVHSWKFALATNTLTGTITTSASQTTTAHATGSCV